MNTPTKTTDIVAALKSAIDSLHDAAIDLGFAEAAFTASGERSDFGRRLNAAEVARDVARADVDRLVTLLAAPGPRPVTMTVTEDDIRDLRVEASDHEDAAQIYICRVALGMPEHEALGKYIAGGAVCAPEWLARMRERYGNKAAAYQACIKTIRRARGLEDA